MNRQLPDSERHPDSGLVAAYAERRLAAADRSAVEAHLAECATCRAEAVAVATWRGTARRRRRWLVTAPAVAATALLLLLVRSPAPAPPVETLRPGEPREGLARIEAWTPAARATVSRDSLRFAWQPDGSDALYRLTVTTVDGAVVWEHVTTDTAAVAPTETRFEFGRPYLWFVDVLLHDGQAATTGLHEFQVR